MPRNLGLMGIDRGLGGSICILSSQVVSLSLQSVEVANFCAAMDTLIDQMVYMWIYLRQQLCENAKVCLPRRLLISGTDENLLIC